MASGKASSVRATLCWEDGESNFAANASPHCSRLTGRNGSKVEEEEEDNRVSGHVTLRQMNRTYCTRMLMALHTHHCKGLGSDNAAIEVIQSLQPI